MRKREDIIKDGARVDFLSLEVLLDIRELLVKNIKKPRGRPRKIK